jgi:predicted RNA binding protein YcfA (HicA-like mRNA interferase family)
MSQLEKQLIRIASLPRDYTWEELLSLLSKLGFKKLDGQGSRVKFRHSTNTYQYIQVHIPHNKNPKTMLVCYVKYVAESLREWGYL